MYTANDYRKKAGKSEYYSQCDNYWRKGLCPKAFGFIIKYKECNNKIGQYWKQHKLKNIPVLIELSRLGKGAHIWLFFDKSIQAVFARKFGFILLDKGAESVNMASFRFYDRLIPTRDCLVDGEIGNLIALPLQGNAIKEGNSAFIDESWNACPD